MSLTAMKSSGDFPSIRTKEYFCFENTPCNVGAESEGFESLADDIGVGLACVWDPLTLETRVSAVACVVEVCVCVSETCLCFLLDGLGSKLSRSECDLVERRVLLGGPDLTCVDRVELFVSDETVMFSEALFARRTVRLWGEHVIWSDWVTLLGSM